jgi:hypothetical protein
MVKLRATRAFAVKDKWERLGVRPVIGRRLPKLKACR